MRRRAAALLLLLLCLPGCGAIKDALDMRARLRDAGHDVSGVNFVSENGTQVVAVVYHPREDAEAEADDILRIVWTTVPYRIDAIDLVVQSGAGGFTVSDSGRTFRDELVARFGPRDPALDEETFGDLLPWRAIGIGAAVAAVVGLVTTVLLVRAARRTKRRDRSGGSFGPPSPPPGTWGSQDPYAAPPE